MDSTPFVRAAEGGRLAVANERTDKVMHYCTKCKSLLDDNQFYHSKNVTKYPPDGTLDQCKKCITMHVDNWDPDTFLWILEEIDIPYVKSVWDSILNRYVTAGSKIIGTTILGRYISTMKLAQWKKYGWKDSEMLAAKDEENYTNTLRKQGYTDEEIAAMAEDRKKPASKPTKPAKSENTQLPQESEVDEDEEEFSKRLTPEDRTMLRLKWGKNYTAEEWIRMEQLYQEMMESYDIQTAGHKDTLIMLCKTSVKANKLLDAGDIEGFQKMSRVYDQLMKSGRFQAAQNKGETGDFIDSVGELVAMCEKEGFIPRYYVDGPQDKVDKTIEDLQHYTRTLVTEEQNLGNMIETSLREIEKDRQRESEVNVEDEVDITEDIFNYERDEVVTDEDYEEFQDMLDEAEEEDNARRQEESG